jgi:hypothetical protein
LQTIEFHANRSSAPICNTANATPDNSIGDSQAAEAQPAR